VTIAPRLACLIGSAAALLCNALAFAADDPIARAGSKYYKGYYVAAGRELIDIKVADMKVERDGRMCSNMKTGGSFDDAGEGGPVLDLHSEVKCPGKGPFTETTRFQLADVASYRALSGSGPHQCEIACRAETRCIAWLAPTASHRFSGLKLRTPDLCEVFSSMLESVDDVREAIEGFLALRNETLLCKDVAVQGVTAEEKKAIAHLTRPLVAEFKQARACLDSVELKDKVELRSGASATLTLTLSYPHGFESHCLSDMPLDVGFACNDASAEPHLRPARPGETRLLQRQVTF
jgi:hypothetical protein